MGTIVIVIVVAGFLMVLQTPTVTAAPESNAPLDCLSCHPNIEFHGLGVGKEACWVCHDSMVTDCAAPRRLRLADGTLLPLADSTPLCAQCHQKRYNAWKEGTHGFPGIVGVHCVVCHNAHLPQIVFWNITEPHPPIAPSPPSPPIVPLVMLGVSLLLVTAVGVVLAKKGKQT